MSVSTKVSAGGIAAAIVTIVVFVLGFTDIDIPPEVAAAAVLLVSWPLAYMVRETNPSESAVETILGREAQEQRRHWAYDPGEPDPGV